MSKLLFAAIFSFLVASEAFAQLVDGGRLPIAIERVSQAAGMCRSDDIQAESGVRGGLPTGAPVDRTCGINIADVAPLLGHPDTLLVNLRSPADFAVFHPLNASNLSVGDLRHKSHWKKKTLVLLGQGKAEDELYEECLQLRKAGFRQVKVVRGGVLMWLAQRLPVAGNPPAVGKAIRLTAAELWSESLSRHTLLFLDETLREMRSEFSGARILPQLSLEALRTAIGRSRTGRQNAAAVTIVFASTQMTHEKIEQWQHALAPIPLLVYVDKKEVFDRDMAAQKAIWSAQEKGPKKLRCGL